MLLATLHHSGSARSAHAHQQQTETVSLTLPTPPLIHPARQKRPTLRYCRLWNAFRWPCCTTRVWRSIRTCRHGSRRQQQRIGGHWHRQIQPPLSQHWICIVAWTFLTTCPRLRLSATLGSSQQLPLPTAIAPCRSILDCSHALMHLIMPTVIHSKHMPAALCCSDCAYRVLAVLARCIQTACPCACHSSGRGAPPGMRVQAPRCHQHA